MPDLAAVSVFVDLVRAETRLYNLLEAQLRERHGIPVGQWQFLELVDRRGPVRVQDIADEVDITIGATSKAVDRMVAAGLLRRRAHPGDGRSQLIELTDKGRRTYEEAAPDLDAWVTERLAVLPAAGRRSLADGLARLSASLVR